MQLRLSFRQIRTLTVALPFADDSPEEEEKDADYVFCTDRFFEDRNGEECTRCANRFRQAHTLFVSLVNDKRCFVLGLYPLYL